MLPRAVSAWFLSVVVVLVPACSRNDVSPDPVAPTAEKGEVEGPIPVPDPGNFGFDPSAAVAAKIGTACTAGRRCGTKGRVALRAYWAGVERHEAAPCKPIELPSESHIGMGFGSVSSGDYACVGKGRLYFESTCVACRLQSTSVIEAEIAELTPQQLANLQHAVRFEGPLRSAAAWQSALASGKRSTLGP